MDRQFYRKLLFMGQVYADIEIINPFHLEKAKRHEMDMDLSLIHI